jgi:hypothetical protein
MSILKVILHRWNKTTKSHDTIHPETEVAQVTDWNQGIVNTLASTALGGLVNTLTSDSLLAKMIQKVLEATGVKYSLGQNGYVCFGSLVGGLIIQWGSNYESQTLTLPIQSKILVITGMHEGTTKQTVSYSQSANKWVGSDASLFLFYIAICK